jgi:hypothetical protein
MEKTGNILVRIAGDLTEIRTEDHPPPQECNSRELPLH